MIGQYLKIPSKASYSWFVWLTFAYLFNAIYAATSKFFIPGIIGLLFGILFVIQIVSNLIYIIRVRPSLNMQKVIINILLILIAFTIANTLTSIFHK